MAMNFAKINQSAVDIINPILSNFRTRDERVAGSRAGLMQGMKDPVGAGADPYNWYKRDNLISYVGDNKLEEMNRNLIELKGELNMVTNAMKTIQNEDVTYGLSDTTEPYKTSGEEYKSGNHSVEPYPGSEDSIDYTNFEGRV